MGVAGADLSDLARRQVPALQRNLKHVIDFWYPATIDRVHGGFALNHDINGRFRGPAPKATVTQARMVWLSARLARFGHEPAAMLAAAEHGHRFLMERLWDSTHGGFVWDVDAGGVPARRNRHLYAQAFGLFALAEYAMASGRTDVLAQATALFELLEDKAKDREHPGYVEAFGPDWAPLPEGEGGYLGAPPDDKLFNTHLHLLEAMTAYARVSASPVARERVLELVAIIMDGIVEPATGACTDRFTRDWRRHGGQHAVVSYGHDLEAIWLVADAWEAVGVSPAPHVERFGRIFEYALANGYDAVDGGFYERGPLGQPADRRGKVWWVQAEAIVSALWMHRLTGDARYLDVFEQTWAWIETRQTDWRDGEWHAVIDPEFRAMGNKADAWKEGYHNGRALMECLGMLKPRLGD